MRAVLCDAWGDPEGLRLGDIEPAEPGPGEVAVAVHAAGVNFADMLMVAGRYQEKPPFPFSPGFEAAGTVAAVGPGVARVRPGDRVLALTDWGAYAQGVLVRESDVFPIPGGMDFVTAAGFPTAYGTAYGALTWRAGLKAGEILLVHGAAGGAGLAAVEVGKALGATVIATARGAEKLDLAAAHGADHVIDSAREDIRARVKELAAEAGKEGADVVFDPVGGEVFESSLRCIAWGGRLIVIGFAAGRVPQIPANILLVKNIAAIGFYWGSYRRRAPKMLEQAFAQLFAWFAGGRLKPHVSHTLDLARAAEAMALLKSRKSTGKVVLTTGRG